MNHPLSGKNVLVTGGAGLVGSHLAERLVELGANVFVLDILIKPGCYFSSQNLEKKVKYLNIDLRDFPKVKEAIKKNQIAYIFHLAAQALVPEAFADPLGTFSANIMGTVNVLEASRQQGGVEGILVASSDKAYGKDCVDAIEDQKVFGDHPYDASKAATDIIARTYYKTYGLPAAVARFGNIFGPGDLYFNRIIPGIMEAIVKNKELLIRSDGQFRRDYLYVKDVVEGYIKMAENIEKIKGEAFNFSTHWNFSVIELIDKIGKTLGKVCGCKILNQQQNEIPAQSLNSEKATKVLGWQPKYSLEAGAEETFDWYKKYFSSYANR